MNREELKEEGIKQIKKKFEKLLKKNRFVNKQANICAVRG